MACPHLRKKHIGRALLHLLNLWWLAPVAKTWELDLPLLFLLHWALWQVQWRMERTFTFQYRSSGRGLRSDIRKPRKNRLSFVDTGLQEVHEVPPGKVRNGSKGGSKKKKRPLYWTPLENWYGNATTWRLCHRLSERIIQSELSWPF